jgi:GNAT superfamily N-acetyltransferase
LYFIQISYIMDGNKDLPSQPCKPSSDDVEFSEANTDQLTAVWTLNAAAWAHPLSVHDHIEREKILSQEPGAGISWKTWVLTLKKDPHIIVASVETFEKPILVSTNGLCRTEKGYGIASVFTNPDYRGYGMARVLLRELKAWLDGEGAGWVSVLYSDIGAVGTKACTRRTN